MKYIVCDVLRDGEPFVRVPVMFPDILVHSMVFAQMRALLEMQYFSNKHKTEVVALSGGEISSMAFEGDVLCHGESTSLGVKSREGLDDHLIRMMDYGSPMAL